MSKTFQVRPRHAFLSDELLDLYLIVFFSPDQPLGTDTWGFDVSTGRCSNFFFMCEGKNLTTNMNRFDDPGICQRYCDDRFEGRSIVSNVQLTKNVLLANTRELNQYF